MSPLLFEASHNDTPVAKNLSQLVMILINLLQAEHNDMHREKIKDDEASNY